MLQTKRRASALKKCPLLMTARMLTIEVRFLLTEQYCGY
jgi:hypothetical protein